MARLSMLLGAVAALAGVAAGAFGAHVLRAGLTPQRLSVFETAVRYQLIHALALLFLALAADRWPAAHWRPALWLFALGIVLFSGSLYALSLSAVSGLGVITPLGGICFLAGWTWVVRTAWRDL